MTRKLALFLCTLGLVLCAVDRLFAGELKAQAFFQRLEGTWDAEGELKGKDGNVILLKQTWTGKADSAESFSVEGSRTLNGETQSYVWTYVHNPVTDSYEATLSGGSGQPIRFEAQLADGAFEMVLTAITGSGNSSITVKDRIEGDAKDRLVSEVTFKGEQGETTLEGKITHNRRK